ncbi:hypothetical protein ACUN22_09635 [Streptomyces anulatus]|uniref:hypothetical protein n=1 Tax=Streptomyces anulatus TaxID=1892 RepID=UPI00403E2C96
MSEAIYGLLGALSGALLTSGAAYWGPLQLQRRVLTADSERSAAARREAERDRAEAQRQAEQDRIATALSQESERSEAAAVKAHARREAEITRIISMRTTTRAWSDLLARTVQDLELRRPVTVEAFDSLVTSARDKAEAALDHALHDGIWIAQSAYGFPMTADRPGEQSRVLAALRLVTELIRAAVIRGQPLNPPQALELRQALDRADAARGTLNTKLLNRLEEVMSITLVGTPGQEDTASAIPVATAAIHPAVYRHERETELDRDPLTGVTRLESRADKKFEQAQLLLRQSETFRAAEKAKSAMEMYTRLRDVTGRPGKLDEALELRERAEAMGSPYVARLQARAAEELGSARQSMSYAPTLALDAAGRAVDLYEQLRQLTGNPGQLEEALELQAHASDARDDSSARHEED